MDLQIKGQLFLVGGASSGFGESITKALVSEGASVIAIARGKEKLSALYEKYLGQVETLACDITAPESIGTIVNAIGQRQIHGVVMNAGGPPAMTAIETKLSDWDNAYKSLLRWKIDLIQHLLPLMIEKKYGRLLFIESASVKQPMENLVLSNSLRLAVVGYAKTLSQEISHLGVTLNILAPGSHNTAAMNRIFDKQHQLTGITKEEATKEFINKTSVGFIGDASDFASLACWLLSAHSRYITGQTISVDGGSIKGVMG